MWQYMKNTWFMSFTTEAVNTWLNIGSNVSPSCDTIKLCSGKRVYVHLLLMLFQAALCLSVTSLILLVSSVEYSCKRWLDSSLKAATVAWPRPRSWRNAYKTINAEALGSSWHWQCDRCDPTIMCHCEGHCGRHFFYIIYLHALFSIYCCGLISTLA